MNFRKRAFINAFGEYIRQGSARENRSLECIRFVDLRSEFADPLAKKIFISHFLKGRDWQWCTQMFNISPQTFRNEVNDVMEEGGRMLLQKRYEPEWSFVRDLFTINDAHTSKGVPYFEHIQEGVEILEGENADIDIIKAFILHPLFQDNKRWPDLLDIVHVFTPKVLVYVMEYRLVAGNHIRKKLKNRNWQIELSPIDGVNLMLKADKIQNYLAFRKNNQDHPEKEELEIYFQKWFEALGIDISKYDTKKSG